MARLQIIGGGKMGEALLGGLLATEWAGPTDLVVIEPDDTTRRLLAERHGGVLFASTPVPRTDALVAVKPDVVGPALAAAADVPRVLSIAAGVRLATIEAIVGPDVPVVRAMPNTPALVGEGAAAVAPGQSATADDLAWAESILGSVGAVVRVDEAHLDAVTGLSGSGPAYVFLLAEALMAAGEAQGLDREVATTLTEQTLLGAARLLRESDDHPSILRQNVTSPGGTTAAGLDVFAAADFEELVHRVVAAATARSVELGGD